MSSAKELNVVIPMAGLGSRFANHKEPKVLIPIADTGTVMFEHVLQNLDMAIKQTPSIRPRYYIITTPVISEHSEFKEAVRRLSSIGIRFRIALQTSPPKGAVDTILHIVDEIDNETSLLIHDCDQIIRWGSPPILQKMASEYHAGIIYTTKTNDLNFSYVLEKDGTVYATVEKQVVSKYGAVGAYYWYSGLDFVNAALRVMNLKIKTKGEYYVCPIYNEIIRRGFVVKHFPVIKHYHIGTPDGLVKYLKEEL